MTQILAWYAALLLLGLVFYPTTARLFGLFRDRGWLFSRVLGLILCAAALWTFNVLRVLPFERWAALVVIAAAAVINGIIFLRNRRQPGKAAGSPRLILSEELLFIAIFLLFFWLIGFKPEAYGTEKPMDYGFLTAMLRGRWMPFADMWYGGEPINYYYGGQYVTAFLIRVSGVTAGYGYNLMRATITALSFTLPFSLVREAAGRFLARQSDVSPEATKPKTVATSPMAPKKSLFAGLLAGLAVAFAGNGHYLIYGIILVIKEKLLPGSVTPLANYPDRPYFYWFPDSTRYIGYYPDTADKTIHEFPAYSSILGDLHAHYINLVFVLLAAGLLYVWLIRREEARLRSDPSLGGLLKEALLDPVIILLGIILGLFKWTNYWDHPIYLVVAGAVIFFGQLRKYRLDPVRFFVNILLQATEIFAFGTLAALPFTASFDMISTEVRRVTSHTPLYQLAVLWGIPVVAVVLLFLMIMRTFHREDILEYEDERALIEAARRRPVEAPGAESLIHRPKGFMRLLATIAPEDLIMLIFGVCAIGLVLLPELVYVRDIYEGEHYRANTMFKLTYQAFILFGMSLSYTIARARVNKNAFYRVAGAVMAALVLILSTYTIRSAAAWFMPGRAEWKEPDASLFIQTYYPTDAGAVKWLNERVDGQIVVLEANGDSYSDYGRVSVATGLPTILGWYVHEWLWRGGTEDLNRRAADIKTIYTSDDAEEVWELIRKYHISYIYIGQLERDKYDSISDKLLQNLGEVAYSDGKTTYIMRVGQND